MNCYNTKEMMFILQLVNFKQLREVIYIKELQNIIFFHTIWNNSHIYAIYEEVLANILCDIILLLYVSSV